MYKKKHVYVCVLNNLSILTALEKIWFILFLTMVRKERL